MIEIPDPLHPAIVHFPIVLIFLGTLFSILTIFTRRGALPQFAAVILILAAGAAQVAVNTGGDQADEVIRRMPDAKPLVLVHAEWGERMRTVAVIAAISAVMALAFYRLAKFRRALAEARREIFSQVKMPKPTANPSREANSCIARALSAQIWS